MRFAITLLLQSFFLIGFAQQSPDSILKVIISAAPQDFKGYRSSFGTGDPGFITYRSLVIIEGTRNNYIKNYLSNTIYEAEVNDSLRSGKALKLLKAWKKKMAALLGPTFKLEKEPFMKFNRGRNKEFAFENAVTSVSVVLVMEHKNEGKKPYKVTLLIFHRH